jgi:hypothetical protein
MRRRLADVACEDAIPSNKPLEWTGHHDFSSGSRYSLPATQGAAFENGALKPSGITKYRSMMNLLK